VAVSAYDVTAFDDNTGISVQGSLNNAVVDIDSSDFSHDTNGFFLGGGAVAHLSRSVLDQDTNGIFNFASGGGAIFTTGDNRVLGSTTAQVDGPAPTVEAPL